MRTLPNRRPHSPLRTLKSKISNPKSRISPTRRRPLFETLENGSLLAQLTFGTPFNLGSGVNTAESENNPTPTADGSSLLFWRYAAPNAPTEILEATPPAELFAGPRQLFPN